MKKIFTIIVSLCASLLSYALVELPVYITDVNGVTDTLVIGLDPEATRGVDPQFGEEVLDENDWASELQGDHFAFVRLYEYVLIPGSGGDEDFVEYGLSHTSIVSNSYGEFLCFHIVVAKDRYPIHVSWDAEVVREDLPWSFITDWKTGGWFDCTFGYPTIKENMIDVPGVDLPFHKENSTVLSKVTVGLTYIVLTDKKYTIGLSPVENNSIPTKTLVNGQLRIQVDGKTYNAQGTLVK